MNPDDESKRRRKAPRKYTQDRKTSTKNQINTHESTCSHSKRESSSFRSFIDCMGNCCLRNIHMAKTLIFHNEDDERLLFRNGRAVIPGMTNEQSILALLDNHSNMNSSEDSISINTSNGENSRNHTGPTLPLIWSSRYDFQLEGTIEEDSIKDSKISLNDYTEEIQMIDINLQNEKETQNVLPIIHDIEPVFISAKKKSSILDHVPKMETIPEGEQFSSFPVEHLSKGNFRDHLHAENVNFQDITNLQSLDTIHMDHRDSWIRSTPTFHVKVEKKVWEDTVTDVSGEIVLETLKRMHEPSKTLWMATIGDAEGLRQAISKGVRLDEVDYLDRTLLHLAVASGSTRAVGVLLENGLDPNAEDGMGRTSLHYATLIRPSVPIAMLLFEYGARIPKRKCSTDIGLFLEFTTMSKPTRVEEQLMSLLVRYGGATLEDVNAPGGRQALHYAAMSDNLDLIRALVHLGADLNVTNHQDMTPSDLASLYKCREAQFCLEDISITNILVDNRSSHQSSGFARSPRMTSNYFF